MRRLRGPISVTVSFGGEVARLVELAVHRQLVAGPEQPVEVRPAQVRVPRRRVDDQAGLALARGGEALAHDLADDLLDLGPGEPRGCCRGCHLSFPRLEGFAGFCGILGESRRACQARRIWL